MKRSVSISFSGFLYILFCLSVIFNFKIYGMLKSIFNALLCYPYFRVSLHIILSVIFNFKIYGMLKSIFNALLCYP
jgi:hypothetical protein